MTRLLKLSITALLAGGLALTAQAQTTLKETFSDSFRVGAALNRQQIFEEDARGVALVLQHFNSISPEDILKWESVHPRPGVYDFTPADRYVAFGKMHGMFIVGHVLVWHNQTPAWVFQDKKGQPVSRRVLLKRMREHIHRVVGRYKGRIQGWDVVNEALNEDGSMRQSPWMKIIGPDYIEKAFRFAREADPKAELYYNDYSLENEPKRAGALRLLSELKSKNVPITGVGLQGHDTLDWPTAEQQSATITAFGGLGLKVMITELDVDVLPQATPEQVADVSLRIEARPELNPYQSGLPDDVQQALAKRYADLFAVFQEHRGVVTRVTFWGVTDSDSWRNRWPIRGRVNYPLLFDREGKPKPAFNAVVGASR